MCQKVKGTIKLRKVLFLLCVVSFIVASMFVYFNLSREKEVYLTYYVDVQKGDDANDGLSVRSAFQTIERAKAEVKTVNSGMTEDIMVLIRGGDYPVSSAIE